MINRIMLEGDSFKESDSSSCSDVGGVQLETGTGVELWDLYLRDGVTGCPGSILPCQSVDMVEKKQEYISCPC